MVDRDLVEQARRGDREAFTVLVHQVSDSLFAVAQRILRDSSLAEDALQYALVLAWRRIPHLREPERFEAWIHRILVHACYDESQRARQWTANVRVRPVDGPSLDGEVFEEARLVGEERQMALGPDRIGGEVDATDVRRA